MVNKVILVGRLGKDPEVKHLESGTVMAKFSLATSENFKDRNGEKVEQTEWHNIVVWRKLAEIAEKYLRKGSQVYIEGRIKTRTWDDQDGKKHYMTEIIADNFQMLSSKNAPQQSGDPGPAEPAVAKEQKPANTAPDQSEQEKSDDLPF
jgi:single-strand DNA-binding protein